VHSIKQTKILTVYIVYIKIYTSKYLATFYSFLSITINDITITLRIVSATATAEFLGKCMLCVPSIQYTLHNTHMHVLLITAKLLVKKD